MYFVLPKGFSDLGLYAKERIRGNFWELDIWGDEELVGSYGLPMVVANMAVDLKDGVISHFWVNPKWRGKGLGTLMLNAANKVLREHGYEKSRIAGYPDESVYPHWGYKVSAKRYLGYDIWER